MDTTTLDTSGLRAKLDAVTAETLNRVTAGFAAIDKLPAFEKVMAIYYIMSCDAETPLSVLGHLRMAARWCPEINDVVAWLEAELDKTMAEVTRDRISRCDCENCMDIRNQQSVTTH